LRTGPLKWSLKVSAKKILVERAFSVPCKWTLLSRLESTNPSTRMEALITLRYIFDFKHKSRSTVPARTGANVDYLDGNNVLLEVIEFAISHHLSFLMCLHRSIDDPAATRLVIQHITNFMRSHKGCRRHYVRAISCTEWCRNPKNPLYSLETVEGILIVDKTDPAGDIFLPEVQQFIYYIGEKNWPLNEEEHPPRVIDRFRRIWSRKTDDRTLALPFHDPVERWFSDRESDRSEGDDRDEGTDDEFSVTFDGVDELLRRSYEHPLGSANHAGGIEDDNELLDDEPDVITMADVVASFNAAEEAGLRSQDRRRNARRLMEEQQNLEETR